MCETTVVLLSCHCWAKFIWVRHSSSTTLGLGLNQSDVKPHQLWLAYIRFTTLHTSYMYNYRPISLLPILSKICERIALNQLMPYLLSNERLSVTQSGSKKFHSTETSLIHTTDTILGGIDKRKKTAVVLLDMSKAFDSINYDILL